MGLSQKIGRLKALFPIIGICIFVYILYDIGIEKIHNALAGINTFYFLIAVTLLAPRIVMSTYKWKMIAKERGIETGLLPLIKLNLIGLFYGTITPLWIGDYIRIPYLKEDTDEPFGKCTSTVLIDQSLEFAALFILALMGSIILISELPSLFLVLFSFFFIFIFIALFFKEKKRSKKFLKILYHICIPKKLRPFMANEFHSFYESMPSLKFLLVPLSIEIFSYLLFFLQLYILALSFPISIPFISFILIYPIASLISLIPVTVSGFGTREGTLIYLFSLYGIADETTVAISLGGYVVTMLIPSFIGGALSILRNKSKNV